MMRIIATDYNHQEWIDMYMYVCSLKRFQLTSNAFP